MPDDHPEWIDSADVFADLGDKVRRGYDPDRVDRHLARLAEAVDKMRSELERRAAAEQESLDVLMRATRRSVE
ncbi:MAG: hypothetical protein ACE5GB_10510, partial [Acidimicrobiales bacterium]